MFLRVLRGERILLLISFYPRLSASKRFVVDTLHALRVFAVKGFCFRAFIGLFPLRNSLSQAILIGITSFRSKEMILRQISCRILRTAVFFGALLSGLAGCTSIPLYTDKPFSADRADFVRTVRVIALEPMPGLDLKGEAAIQDAFETELTDELRNLGFLVVPSRQFAQLWQQLSKEDRTLYDPITGKRDDARAAEIRKRVVTELESRHQADAVLLPRMIVSNALLSGCFARWNGIEQQIDGCNAAGEKLRGKISVLSLLVTIEGRDGRVLFRNAGGIQPGVRLNTDAPGAAQFDKLEEEQILTDRAKNRIAVAVALSPLLQKPK